MVSPAVFIPLAEESGLILSLGKWVLNEACRQLSCWAMQPETAHLSLAVNISARQIHQPDFVDQVLAAMQYANIAPDKLKLELTESLLLEDTEDIIEKMNNRFDIVLDDGFSTDFEKWFWSIIGEGPHARSFSGSHDDEMHSRLRMKNYSNIRSSL